MAITDLRAATLAVDLPASHALTRIPGLVHQKVLSGNLTLTNQYPSILRLDPDGQNRDITLEAVASSENLYRRIINFAGGAENLVVKNAGGDTIGTINQNEQGEFWCDGASWSLICITAIALT